MTHDNDKQSAEHRWIELIRKGDEEAFEKLFKAYYLHLTRFAWRFIGSKAIAEEMTQDLFADIWEKKEDWKYVGSLRPFLYRVMKEKCLNYLKHQKVRQKYDGQWMEQWNTISSEFEDQDKEEQTQIVRDALKEAINNLPARSQMAYKLHKYDGLSYNEIAEVMDISVKTVESQMTRALKILREELAYLLPFLFVTVLL